MAKQYRYPGSRPFSVEDKKMFFGRDQDILEVAKFINVEKLVVLCSRSGMGKSSLINAGVVPKLIEENEYIPFTIRLNSYAEINQTYNEIMPIFKERLALAIDKYYTDKGIYSYDIDNFLLKIDDSDVTVWQMLKSVQLLHKQKEPNSKKTLLLIFDQFEELFTYPEGEQHFAETIAELLNQTTPRDFKRSFKRKLYENPELLSEDELNFLDEPLEIKILFSIRADKLNFLNRLTTHLPNILRNCYELQPLTREKATTAIIRPARKKDESYISEPFYYSPEALEKILDYLTQNDTKDIESFQLQVLCQHIEEDIVMSKQDDFVEVDDIGDLKDVYQNYYQNQIARIKEPKDQEYARVLIEEGLIFEEEQRRISLYEGQIRRMYKISPELLQELVDAHLLRAEPSPEGDGFNYELSHDSLVAPILKAKTNRKSEEHFLKEKLEMKRLAEQERKEKLIYARRFAIGGGAALIIFVIMLVVIILVNNLRTSVISQKDILARQDTANNLAAKALQLQRQDPTNALWLIQKAIQTMPDNIDKSSLWLIRSNILDDNSFYEKVCTNAHEEGISTMTVSPDGKWIVTADATGKLVLWNEKGVKIQTFKEDGMKFAYVSFTMDSQQFVAGGTFVNTDGKRARILKYNIKNTKSNGTEIIKLGLDSKLAGLVCSPDGVSIFVAFNVDNGVNRTAAIWKYNLNGIREKQLERKTGNFLHISAIAVSKDGKKVASASYEDFSTANLQLWSSTGNFLSETEVDSDGLAIVSYLDFHPTGNYLLSASQDKRVTKWNILTNDFVEEQIFRGHSAEVNMAVFSPDGKSILTASNDNEAILWALNGKAIKNFKGHTDKVTAVAFDKTGDYVFTSSMDKRMLFWNLKGFQRLVIKGHKAPITAVDASRDGKYFASTSEDATIKIWKNNGQNLLSIENAHDDNILSINFHPNSAQFITCSQDGNLKLWNLKGQNIQTWRPADSEHLYTAHFTPDGNQILVGAETKSVLLDAKTGKVIKSWDDGSKVVLMSDNGTVVIASVTIKAGKANDMKDFENSEAYNTELPQFYNAGAIDTKGNYLIVGREDNTAKIWDMKKEIAISNLRGHEAPVTCTAFSLDGKYVATGSSDMTIRIWDFNGKELFTLSGNTRSINAVCFSPDGKYIISGGKDNNLIVWYNLETFLNSGRIHKP
ncbi:MAG: hypothetical protein EAZ55_11600 [Cytophagales bacterium]|nr:MAG: hypothetical protein EAZ55_11600 [Cytophagales bacterium]